MPLRHDSILLRPSKELQRKLELVNQEPAYNSVTETFPIKAGKFAWLPKSSPHPDTANFPNHTLVVQGKAQGDDSNWYLVRVYEIIPGPPLVGREMSSQFGGGLLVTTRQDVMDASAAGSAIAAGSAGLNIVSVSVQPDDQTSKFKLQKSELPQGESWPILIEYEYISEVDEFIKTEKTFVLNNPLVNLPSKSGGDEILSAGSSTVPPTFRDRVVFEFKDYDKYKTIRVKTTYPGSMIGKTWTFRAPFSYAIPAEMREDPIVKKSQPTMLAALAALFPSLGLEDIVMDVDLDWDLKPGYTKNFSATVHRTISLNSTTEVEIDLIPEAYSRVFELSYCNGESFSPYSLNNRLKRISLPSCIHPAWNILVGKRASLIGTAGTGGIVWSLGSATEMYLTAPDTLPPAIPYGEEIIAKVASSSWRGGMFVNDIYKIILTDPHPVVVP